MSIEDAENVLEILKTNSHFNILGNLTHSSALIENSSNPQEYRDMIPKMYMVKN
jgi:hypothetical protein